MKKESDYILNLLNIKNIKSPLTKNKFDGISYYTKTSISFNEGGRYFNFYINFKTKFFYLYLHFFRTYLNLTDKTTYFKWLGI